MITRAAALSSRRRTSPEIRFWCKVRLSPTCWEWVGGTTFGYGRFYDGERVVLATRWVWQHIHGPLDQGLEVAHHCDNPCCVRPSHLFAATHAENVNDMHVKRRGVPPPLRAHRKLTDDQIDEIRSVFTGEHGQQAALARQYGVGQNCISRLVRGVTWVT